MIELRYRLNTDRIVRAFNQMSNPNRRDVMRKVAAVLQDITDQAFADEAAPDGTAWPDITTAHREWRNKKGYTGSILQMTGNLLSDSISTKYDSKSASIGSNKIYAATHQFGDERRNIPARPFLGLSEEGAAEIVKIIEDTVSDILR